MCIYRASAAALKRDLSPVKQSAILCCVLVIWLENEI